MIPLVVTARLAGPFASQRCAPALDSLLAYQVALRRELRPPRDASECERIEIPVQYEPGGRFHLCSSAVFDVDARELKYVNKRAPVEQYQTIGDAKIRRVLISGGVNKSYRIPMETQHTSGDVLRWYCVGDADAIGELLTTALYLGKRRAVGLGKVLRWTVEPCEPWGDGFPIVRDGKPLRPLPADWPGLVKPKLRRRVLTYPYWDHSAEEMCACP